MEKLKRIRIEGFLSIRELDLELGDVTVLVGANGSGKSNFVELFDMLRSLVSESLKIYIARRGGASSVLHYGSHRTAILRLQLDFESAASVREYGCTLTIASPDAMVFSHEYVRYPVNSDQGTLWINRELNPVNWETQLVSLSRSAEQAEAKAAAAVVLDGLSHIQVYHFHDTSDKSRIRTSQDVDQNRFLLSDGANLASFLYMLKEAKPQHYRRILSAVRLAVPYLHEFILEPDRLNTKAIQLLWRDRISDNQFGPHQLSDGSLRAIALITALLQPEEFLPGIVVIDEPGLGLHPSAIGLIASLVRSVSEKRQVIVATQSPKFLSEFSPEDVVVVERVEDGKGYGESVFKRLSREELGNWLQDYDLGTLYEMQVTGGGPQ